MAPAAIQAFKCVHNKNYLCYRCALVSSKPKKTREIQRNSIFLCHIFFIPYIIHGTDKRDIKKFFSPSLPTALHESVFCVFCKIPEVLYLYRYSRYQR